MDDPVARGVIASGDKNGITLGDRNTDGTSSRLFDVGLRGPRNQSMVFRTNAKGTYTVDFDDPHLVAINPKEESRKRGGIDHSKTVCFAWLEW